MKQPRTRLTVTRETLRTLVAADLRRAAGGRAATDGATGCQSEAGGCGDSYGWSCINQSCTTSSTVRTTGG